MTKLTKQQQKDNARKAYLAIVSPAREAYEAKLAKIDAQPDKVDEIITHNGWINTIVIKKRGSDELSNL